MSICEKTTLYYLKIFERNDYSGANLSPYQFPINEDLHKINI